MILLTKGWHGTFTFDTDVGPQKFHEKDTPRIGGTALFVGFWLAAIVASPTTRELMIHLGLCGAIAFLVGSSEDVWKKTHPGLRLAATAGAALSFCLVTNFSITRLALPIADQFLENPLVSVTFTVFAIAGLMNAINIIDGFHGLASGSVVLMTGAFGVVAASVGDEQLLLVTVVVAAIMLGFLMFNFPFGYLFLGDGGAYVSGFWLACVAVLLPARNPDVSPWLSLLIVIYPVTETVYSIFRKTLRGGRSPLVPDGLHLHMLVHRSFAKLIGQALHRPRLTNPITSVLLCSLCLPGLLVAILAPSRHWWLGAGIALQISLYAAVYRAALGCRTFRPTPPSVIGERSISSAEVTRTPPSIV
jgi:UDP-N-acetylmuramyl pentapeptide phosphotransferase/UDP-N-acetylglucosamine-1-phosphate transferase